MDKNKIAIIAKQIETKEDLLSLLNQIKMDEMAEFGMAEKFYPFTMKNLNYYCNPNNVFHRYKQFNIKKKNGGSRQITAPRNESFMLMLRYVNEIFKSVYTPSSYAMGFAEGRSVVLNANIHRGQNYIFNIDLKDFFPSIDQARIWKRIQMKPLCFKKSIANILAGLCSMKMKMEDGTIRYVLPQGAPTSPIITNMICDKLDHRLAGLAKRFGLHYTRYADDITFSSMHNVYQTTGEFIKELKRIITNQGFTINDKKTRLQKVGSRQEVTGIIVSEKINVEKKYVRNIRNLLYIWDRYGYDVAYNKFFPKYKIEKGHVKKGNPDMVNVISGKLMFLKMVKGEEDSVYVKLKTKFDKLVTSFYDTSKTSKNGVTYIETTSVIEFEKKNDTEVIIMQSKPHEICSETKDAEENVQKIMQTHVSHRYAYFFLGGKKQLASVSKGISHDEEVQKSILSISHCRDEKGNLFWLIHRSDKNNISPVVFVDLDELNDTLDSLLY